MRRMYSSREAQDPEAFEKDTKNLRMKLHRHINPLTPGERQAILDEASEQGGEVSLLAPALRRSATSDPSGGPLCLLAAAAAGLPTVDMDISGLTSPGGVESGPSPPRPEVLFDSSMSPAELCLNSAFMLQAKAAVSALVEAQCTAACSEEV
ncbi:hypothetical protein B484DRAFT_462247 [Ochromonadaceae sp. CCMP2298]|nr:hypothetical protein B484DRAFT_462247 [Ochromonadaceae sp. CCMP2298]